MLVFSSKSSFMQFGLGWESWEKLGRKRHRPGTKTSPAREAGMGNVFTFEVDGSLLIRDLADVFGS
jgi:hypothetical protein